MTTNRNKVNSEKQNPSRVWFAKFLIIVILAIIFLVLARTMVRHHFFSGGQLNRNETTEP